VTRSFARALWTWLFDGSPCWSFLLLVLGFGLVGPSSWWILAFGLPALLFSVAAQSQIALHRRRQELLRDVAVGLVRGYWSVAPADDRADALEYVPSDVLAQALKEASGE
jgi:hypothetical protein